MLKNKFIKAVLIIGALIVLSGAYDSILVSEKIIEINGEFLKAEIADTGRARERGLSGRDKIYSDQGLLFIFDNLDYHSIWMKDMMFSIDIIWMDEDGYIIDYEERVSPDTFPETFSPEKPAKYVLEVESGFVERKGLEVGDKLDI